MNDFYAFLIVSAGILLAVLQAWGNYRLAVVEGFGDSAIMGVLAALVGAFFIVGSIILAGAVTS